MKTSGRPMIGTRIARARRSRACRPSRAPRHSARRPAPRRRPALPVPRPRRRHRAFRHRSAATSSMAANLRRTFNPTSSSRTRQNACHPVRRHRPAAFMNYKNWLSLNADVKLQRTRDNNLDSFYPQRSALLNSEGLTLSQLYVTVRPFEGLSVYGGKIHPEFRLRLRGSAGHLLQFRHRLRAGRADRVRRRIRTSRPPRPARLAADARPERHALLARDLLSRHLRPVPIAVLASRP